MTTMVRARLAQRFSDPARLTRGAQTDVGVRRGRVAIMLTHDGMTSQSL